MNQTESLHFPVAVNRQFVDKVTPGSGRFWQFNMAFQNETVTLPELVDLIVAGHAWTAPHRQVRHHRPRRKNPDYHTTYRVKANVIHSQLLALDADTEDIASSFSGLLQDPFIARHAALLHATASSRPEHPRSRIIFLLDGPLAPDAYEEALQALLFRYTFCDQSVKQAAAVFYGAKACAYCLLRQVLPTAALAAEILAPYRAHLAAEKARRAADRAERATALQTTGVPPAAQVVAYIDQVYSDVLSELAQLPAGVGLRHQRLFESALQLASLRAAPWLSQKARRRLRNLEDDLFEAAETNGYVADYGEDSAWRTIDDGVDFGRLRPYTEPSWLAAGDYFEMGEAVEAVIGGRIVASGRIAGLREKGHWEFRLDSTPRVWFARNHLRRCESGER